MQFTDLYTLNTIQLIPDILYFLCVQTLNTFILFPLILFCIWIFKNKSLRWSYWLWSLILVRMILPVDISYPDFISDRFKISYPTVHGRLAESERSLNTTLQKMISASGEHNAFTRQPQEYFDVSDTIPALWAMGVLILFSFFFLAHFRVSALLRHATPVVDNNINALASTLKKRLKISRNIKIAYSVNCRNPFTTGVINPIICLPYSMLESDHPSLIQSVIAHEMVHIKRYDVLMIYFQGIVKTIFFFNPLVWIASHYLCRTREHICDQEVIHTRCVTPVEYGASLVEAVKYCRSEQKQLKMVPALFSTEASNIKTRIIKILKDNDMKKPHRLTICLVLLIITFVTLPMTSLGNLSGQPDTLISGGVHRIVIQGDELKAERRYHEGPMNCTFYGAKTVEISKDGGPMKRIDINGKIYCKEENNRLNIQFRNNVTGADLDLYLIRNKLDEHKKLRKGFFNIKSTRIINGTDNGIQRLIFQGNVIFDANEFGLRLFAPKMILVDPKNQIDFNS